MSDYLANQHCDCLTDVDLSRVRAVVFGVQRSGSSWAWQVLGRLLGDGVLKTHRYLLLPNDMPVVATVRDFRDCVVSQWRVWHPQRTRMDRPDLFLHVGIFQENLWALHQYSLRHGCLTVGMYEQVRRIPKLWFASLLRFCGTGSPDYPAIRRAVRLFQMDANRRVADQLTEPDASRLLVPHHVHEGKPGTWRRFVAREDWPLLTDLLREPLAWYGYLK
mgnify:CR=1 FL=1